MEETTKKTWQEELQELMEKVPDDKRQRARDFIVGHLTALQEDASKPVMQE